MVEYFSFPTLERWSNGLGEIAVSSTPLGELLPQWRDFCQNEPPPRSSAPNWILCSESATLGLVLDALRQDFSLAPEHASLLFTFAPDQQQQVSSMFLILKRWDDPEALALAGEKDVDPAVMQVCLPGKEFSLVKQDFTTFTHAIHTRLLPQLVRNTIGCRKLLQMMCRWLVSLFYYYEPKQSKPESSVPRMMKSVLLLSTGLADLKFDSECIALLQYVLEENERRWPGKHWNVRSVLLQALANHLPTPLEQIAIYRESIQIDLAEFEQSSLVPQQQQQQQAFLCKHLVNNWRVVADLYHAMEDYDGELNIILELCQFHEKIRLVFRNEFTQDLKRAGVLYLVLLANLRRLHHPKRLNLIKKTAAPPTSKEHDLLLSAANVFERILHINRPTTTATAIGENKFYQDFRQEHISLAEVYAELEDYNNAERLYQDIFNKMVRLGDYDECALLVAYAEVLGKKNEFLRSVMLVERAFEVQTRKNFGHALCQDNVNHLTRLELVYESARFNLAMLIADVEHQIATLVSNTHAHLGSSGSGNDIGTKLWEDFPDSADGNDGEDNKEEMIDDLEQVLGRFPHPPQPGWMPQTGLCLVQSNSKDDQVQYYVSCLNRAKVLEAFAVQMRDESQRKSISFAKTLYHRAMLERRLEDVQGKYDLAVQVGNKPGVVDLAGEVAMLCKQLGRSEQALAARRNGVSTALGLNDNVPFPLLLTDMDELAVEFFNLRMFPEAVDMFGLVAQFGEQLALASFQTKALCNKAKALECMRTPDSLNEAAALYASCCDLFPLYSPERLLVLRALFDCLVAMQSRSEEWLDRITQCAKLMLPCLAVGERVPFLIRLCQLLLQHDDVEEAEQYCQQALELAEPDSMAMYLVMEMRIAICRLNDDWDAAQVYCDEAFRLLQGFVQGAERDLWHFYCNVQLPLWLERAEMLPFGCPFALALVDQVVTKCDLAIQFARAKNDMKFAVPFCELKGDGFFLNESFDRAYASYQLGYMYSGEEHSGLAEKMDMVRDAVEEGDVATTDSLLCSEEDGEEGSTSSSSRCAEYYADEDEEEDDEEEEDDKRTERQTSKRRRSG